LLIQNKKNWTACELVDPIVVKTCFKIVLFWQHC